MKWTLFAAVVALFAAALSFADEPAAAKAAQLEGTWLIEGVNLAGIEIPAETLKDGKVVFKGDDYVATVADVTDRGSWKRNASQKPATLDITGIEGPSALKTYLCIYELKDDVLKVCYDPLGNGRPSEFKVAAGSAQVLVTLKREKK